jgi:SAM-dependent methyltransferase
MSAPSVPDASLRAFVRESPIHRTALLAAVERSAAALPAGTRVLDAGAGNAPYRPLFAHCEYLTQDWTASVHPGARVADVVGDLHELPVSDGSFDFVLCTEVLEHVADPARVLAELARILKPGGGLLLTVPFVMELHEEPHDHYRYTSHGLRGLLEDAGFTVGAIDPVSGWFSTLAQVLRNGGNAIQPLHAPARPATRALAFALLALSVLFVPLARRLDALDQRHALPIGWACVATRAL